MNNWTSSAQPHAVKFIPLFTIQIFSKVSSSEILTTHNWTRNFYKNNLNKYYHPFAMFSCVKHEIGAILFYFDSWFPSNFSTNPPWQLGQITSCNENIKSAKMELDSRASTFNKDTVDNLILKF